jgi:hypothetical protein
VEVGGSKPLAPTTPGREDGARRFLPLLFLIVVFLFLAWAGWSAITAFAASRDANAGRLAVERARDKASPEEIVDGKPLPDLQEARTKFRRAHSRIRHPLLAPARILPIVGRQIRSADALTSAATTVTEAAIEAIEDGRTILKAPRNTGPARIALLRKVASVAGTAERRIGAADLGPEGGLIGPLGKARREFGEEIDELQRTLRNAAAAAGAAADLLDGPRRTVVFAANNAEMRNGSGMFLSVGEMATSHGEIDLGNMRPVPAIVVPRGIPVTGDMAARWGWANPSRDWTSLMMSPHFETSAQLAATMWKAATGRTVDGVIAVDPPGFRALLRATGPVMVNGKRIGPDNVIRELLHDQYLDFPTFDVGRFRREGLGDIAKAVMGKLNRGTWDPAELMSGLADAVRGRHVMLWSSRAAEQKAWHIAGADGRLDASSLMVSLLNRGGNKLDWFMRAKAEITFTHKGNATEGVLRVTLRNETPRGQPLYIQGPHPDSGGVAGEYVGILAITLPKGAGGGRIDGVAKLGVVGPDGPTRVVGVYFTLPRGGTRTFVIRFDLADTAGSLRVEPAARVPATGWRYGTEEWEDSVPRVVRWGTKEP